MSEFFWPEWTLSRGIQPREWPFACIGPGRVGSALTRALTELGFPAVAVGGGSRGSAERLAQEVGGEVIVEPYTGLGDRARLILITVPDKNISDTAVVLGKRAGLKEGSCLVQTSATEPSEVMHRAAAETGGVFLLSLHPLKPFPDRDRDLRHFREIIIGIEGGGPARPFGRALALMLGGSPLDLTPEMKGEYHASGIIAFTGIMALAGAVESICRGLGLDRIFMEKGILPGMRAAVEAVESQGLPACLTGPVSRGDADVVAGHMRELSESFPELLPLYRELARINLRIAAEGGILEPESVEELRQILDS